MNFTPATLTLSIGLAIGSTSVSASDGPVGLAQGYSPGATATHATRVFWGDSHVHTGLSLDAGLFGNRLGLDEAYLMPVEGDRVNAIGVWKGTGGGKSLLFIGHG